MRMHSWTGEGLSCPTHAHLAGVGAESMTSNLKTGDRWVIRNSAILVVENVEMLSEG